MFKHIKNITKNDVNILTFFKNAKFSNYVYFFPVLGSIMYIKLFSNLVFSKLKDDKTSISLIRRIGSIIVFPQILLLVAIVVCLSFAKNMFLFYIFRISEIDKLNDQLIDSIIPLCISIFLLLMSPFVNYFSIYLSNSYLNKVIKNALNLNFNKVNDVEGVENDEEIMDYPTWVNNVFNSNKFFTTSNLTTEDLSLPKKRNIYSLQNKFFSNKASQIIFFDSYVFRFFSNKIFKNRISLLCIYVNNVLKMKQMKTISFNKIITMNFFLSLCFWVLGGLLIALTLWIGYDKIEFTQSWQKWFFPLITLFVISTIWYFTFIFWFSSFKKQLLIKNINSVISKWSLEYQQTI